MARAPTLPSLHELRNPTSTEAQIVALKQLKNEIIGHDQRKEMAIRHGVVAPLTRILLSCARVGGKKRSGAANGSTFEENPDGGPGRHMERNPLGGPLTKEDELRLQAVLVVGSLAHGGLPSIAPLVAGGILPPLLSALSPSTLSPRLVTATLRTLLNIAEAFDNDVQDVASNAASSLASQLYLRPAIDSLTEILLQRTASPRVGEQLELTARLIALTCKRQYKEAAVKAGILDALATRLASLIAATGYALPEADHSVIVGLPPVPPNTNLTSILRAIGVIVTGSAYRSARLLYSQSIIGIFPLSRTPVPTDPYMSFMENSPTQPRYNPVDQLLPQLQALQNKTDNKYSQAFPALGSFTSAGIIRGYHDGNGQSSSRTISGVEFGSPLITWLIHIARSGTGLDRLASVMTLTHLIRGIDQQAVNAAEPSRNRDRTLALLVVPLIVRMIEEATAESASSSSRSEKENWVLTVKESAPMALALLIEDSPVLQKAAYDAGAIKKLCHILKKTFDPSPTNNKPMWLPHPRSPASGSFDPSSAIGGPGLPAGTVHALTCRATSLKALGALAQKEDLYRKEIISNGIVSFVVDSMEPYEDGPIPGSQPLGSVGAAQTADAAPKEGNPDFVIVAACEVATALSRSVSILRTSLIDGGLARPAFALLRHPNVDVQLATTDVLTNLLLHFSPMREDLMADGVMKTLCEHAHSANSKMRIGSLWALKHLVGGSATNDLKISCLEELGTGWLIQVMTGESGSLRSQHALGMGTSNAAGERVDLLNSPEEPSMDIDDGNDSADSDVEDDEAMADSIGSLRMPRYSCRPTSSTYAARLKAIKTAEQSPFLRAQRDDIRIQEQALDFIRNLIGEPGPGHPEMIDHLLQSLGTNRFFEILAAKLRPSSSTAAAPASTSPIGKRPMLSIASNSNYTQNNTNHFHQHTEILISILFILVHVANGTPRHRAMLISQPSLFPPHINSPTPNSPHHTAYTAPPTFNGPLLPLLSHPSRRIRVACVWLVHNLLWQDDSADESAARQRALELRRCGVEDACRRLREDTDLDTKERARSVGEMFAKLLEGVPSSVGEGVRMGSGGLGESVASGRVWH